MRLGWLKQQSAPSPGAMGKAIPVRNPEVSCSREGNIVTVQGPLARPNLLLRMASKSSGKPLVKSYELEEVGSFVWDLIDGKLTFDALSKELRIRYKMNKAEADASLGAFLQMLVQRGLIVMAAKKTK